MSTTWSQRQDLLSREVHPADIIPAWASAYGDDQYGIWADLHVGQKASKDEGMPVVQRMRYIEPGTFWMGSPDDELERNESEGPRHLVTLTHGFWLADTACTQAMWALVMGENPSHFKGDDRPVDSVSWNSVRRFMEQLEAMVDGCGARLPTEAEWEYACRAGTQTPFSFGSNITTDQVNYDGNYPYAKGKKGVYRQATVPVKSLPCNDWGLYQMHGNVWEWCADDQRTYTTEHVMNPEGSKESGRSHRVLRGGSWGHYARGCRSAYRHANVPGRGWSTTASVLP